MENYPILKKTWIFDLDGTLVVHGGYKTGPDILLDGIFDFFLNIPENDFIVIITGRSKKYKKVTINNLKALGIRYDHIIFEAGTGARILVNDTKPSGYITAHCKSVKRNQGLDLQDFNFFMTL